jgi:ABC-2 type transport system permease protein
MANIYRIFKKEFGGYLNSPSSYIFLIIFLLLNSGLFFFMTKFFKFGQADLGGFFGFLPWLFLFLIPAIAMRIWAEEKRSGTDELLMTMPVRDFEAVLGKYFAALLLVIIALVLTFPLPMVLRHFAEPKAPVDWGPIWSGYVGAMLLGASVLAIGAWASSLTVNQIIAFIIGCTVSFCLLIIGVNSVVTSLPGWLTTPVSSLSLFTHYESLYRGVLTPADVIYYLSVIAFFVFLNIRSVESRKWK